MRFAGSVTSVLLGLLASAVSAPCDIFETDTPCVAAHSVVRALYNSYAGPLYRVQRRSDNATLDIAPRSAGGFADAAAQDDFCGRSAVPGIGSTVTLRPRGSPFLSFRHCDAQGFVSPDDGDDHFFTIAAPLSGTPGAVSFRSVNFPTYYVAPVTTAEPGRAGISQTAAAADASWVAAPAPGGGFTLTNVGRGLALAVGGNLTGDCAANYKAPSASVYLLDAPGAWDVVAAPECAITRIFDQSPRGNDISTAPAGGAVPRPDKGVAADAFPTVVGGHRVYGAYFAGGMGYRRDNTSGIAVGDEAETIYAVWGGGIFNNGCCADYGNAETNDHDDGAGTMECVYVDCTQHSI
jgi:hypothetical protein